MTFDLIDHDCPCGSGEPREAVSDARGIFVTFACSKCRARKLKGYRREIFTNPGYSHSEPIGEPIPFREAMTPEMNVVATAPIPGSRTPSLPVAGATSTPFSSAIAGEHRANPDPVQGGGGGLPELARTGLYAPLNG